MKSIIDSCMKKWQLSDVTPLVPSAGANNYVARAYSELYKADVVLKILLADTNEPEALKLFNGNSCVQLLDYELTIKSLLLEYITPGITLKTLFPAQDDKAIEITAELIRTLPIKVLHEQAKEFKTVNQWLDLLFTFQNKKISQHLLQKAQQLTEQLLSSKSELYLLHGDLHHENILQSGDAWIAIDPKGVVGPLEYEVGRFIMNPIPDLLQQPNAKEIIKNRIEKFSEILGFDKQVLLEWAFVQAVLSACWTQEGGSEEFFNYFVRCAQTIEKEL